MNTVGIFAGRGDVIIAMALASVFGALIGWYIRGGITSIRNRLKKNKA